MMFPRTTLPALLLAALLPVTSFATAPPKTASEAPTMTPNPVPITPPGPAQAVPFDSGRWRWSAGTHRVESYLGRQSLYLEKGTASVAGVNFINGSIEFDMAFSANRGFMGAIWRVRDTKNYEEFYLRPHQSGNPDASQYTPVFHGIEGWQLYHGKRYSVPLVHRFNEWTHVKVIFSGDQAEIYIRDMENPVLFVDGLKRSVEAGSIGVNAGDFAPAHFSGFSYTVMDSPRLKGKAPSPAPVPAFTLPSWAVSDAFPESALDATPGKSGGKNTLARDLVTARRWTRLAAEPSGLTDLARVQGLKGGNDTVLVKQILVSSREQIKRFDFGFCDRVRVYLNGRLLFRGDDTPRSRDYRFLGSIGYFDALYLPLAEGENEIVMAISEDVGGWGVQAKLEDFSGITLKDSLKDTLKH
jgi:hypothetical protein